MYIAGEGQMEELPNKVKESVAETKKAEARVTHVVLKDVNLEYITYTAKVSVTNPYSAPVPILEISHTLKSANRFFFLSILN